MPWRGKFLEWGWNMDDSECGANVAQKICCYCGPTKKELRPYGPDGATCCYDCMNSSEERRAIVAQQFYAAKRRAESESLVGIAIYGSENGPMPLLPKKGFR